MRSLRFAVAAVSISILGPLSAHATQINGASTGISNPAQTITFDEVALPAFTLVTNQYAAYGVTFSPGLYYDPQSYSATGLGGKFVGNFTPPTEPAFINPVTLNFSSTQTAVAFGTAGDNTPFLVQAFLNGSLVDSFTGSFSAGGGYMGFTGESFNSIVISQAGAGGGPYIGIDNIELGNTAATPEPSSLALLGSGLLGIIGTLRRRSRSIA